MVAIAFDLLEVQTEGGLSPLSKNRLQVNAALCRHGGLCRSCMPSHPSRSPGGLRQRREQALRRMRRAEIATYIATVVSAGAYLFLAIPARNWFSVAETVLWAGAMAALAFALGHRHQAWAAATLIAFLIFGVIARTLAMGRPPFVLIVALLIYLYLSAYRAARDYMTLTSSPVEPGSPAA
jgi:hypothetical protein